MKKGYLIFFFFELLLTIHLLYDCIMAQHIQKMTIPFYIQSNRLIPSTSVLIQYLSIACITEYEVGAILQSSSRVLEKEHLLYWINYMAPYTYIDRLPRAYCMNWLDNRLKPREKINILVKITCNYHEILNLHQETWIQNGHISYYFFCFPETWWS